MRCANTEHIPDRNNWNRNSAMSCKPSPTIEVPVSSKNANGKISEYFVSTNWITLDLKWSPEWNASLDAPTSVKCVSCRGVCQMLMSIVVQSVNSNLMTYTRANRRNNVKRARHSTPAQIELNFHLFFTTLLRVIPNRRYGRIPRGKHVWRLQWDRLRWRGKFQLYSNVCQHNQLLFAKIVCSCKRLSHAAISNPV